MKAIFYIVSIVVIAAAAFFSYSNSNKIQSEIDRYGEARDKKRNVEGTIERDTKVLEDAEGALATSKENNAVLKNSLDNEKAKQAASEKSLDGYRVQIEEQDERLAELAQIEAEVKAKLGDLRWEDIPPAIRKLQEERKDKGNRMAELTVIVENLTKELGDKRDEYGRQTSTLAEVRRKIALNSKVGAVTVVDSTWGFVVVNLGANNSNITPQTKLLVTRDGRLLGTLNPTSVEPTQTVCDLNARDINPGMRIQPGDRVTLSDSVGGR